MRDNTTNRYTVIGVASTAKDSLVNRTVVANYARINQVLPWIHSIIHDIKKEPKTKSSVEKNTANSER